MYCISVTCGACLPLGTLPLRWMAASAVLRRIAAGKLSGALSSSPSSSLIKTIFSYHQLPSYPAIAARHQHHHSNTVVRHSLLIKVGTSRAMSANAVGQAENGTQPPSFRIAVAQMTATGDQEANFVTCSRLAQDARTAGASALFLPECFSFIGSNQAESLQAAQPLTGPLMTRYQELAKSSGLWLSLGGFQEVGPDPQHIHNTHCVVDPSGSLAAVYRKIHLFDVDVPNGPVLMESRTTAPGNKMVTCDLTEGVRLGLTTCYDLRFPEMYQKLTWELRCTLLAVPSAFTKVTGAAHWEVLLRARAIECQAYVVAAAQAGKHNEKRESYGHALIVDPWGEVVARLDDPLATGIAVADINLENLRSVRLKMPIQQHRAKGYPAYSDARVQDMLTSK